MPINGKKTKAVKRKAVRRNLLDVGTRAPSVLRNARPQVSVSCSCSECVYWDRWNEERKKRVYN